MHLHSAFAYISRNRPDAYGRRLRDLNKPVLQITITLAKATGQVNNQKEILCEK